MIMQRKSFDDILDVLKRLVERMVVLDPSIKERVNKKLMESEKKTSIKAAIEHARYLVSSLRVPDAFIHDIHGHERYLMENYEAFYLELARAFESIYPDKFKKIENAHVWSEPWMTSDLSFCLKIIGN